MGTIIHRPAAALGSGAGFAIGSAEIVSGKFPEQGDSPPKFTRYLNVTLREGFLYGFGVALSGSGRVRADAELCHIPDSQTLRQRRGNHSLRAADQRPLG
jgi:hypothetical protein